MNRSVEGLYRSLEPLRLYALRQDSYIDKELLCYGEGFEAAEKLFGEILAGAFAGAAGGPLPGSADAFTPEGMRGALLALGIEAEITERAPEESLAVKAENVPGGTLDPARMKERILAVLPAHLECIFGEGGETGGEPGDLSWDALEERFGDWDARDGEGLVWEELDAMT